LEEQDVPGFDYETFTFYEYGRKVSSRISRDIELRMVLNFRMPLPYVNVPELKDKLVRHNLGLNPRPIDIYNLIPWTWLVDWYTGLGNYIEMIDILSSDDTLINWGMITAEVNGKLTTEFSSKIDSFAGSSFNYASSGGYHTVNFPHTSVLDYTFQLRKDLATIMEVKTIADPTSLTSYQLSILGAILSQSFDFRRR
jgi:hypothetical protein